MDNDEMRSPETATVESLYLAHAATLRGRLLALTRDPSLAEYLASEAFLRLTIEIRAGRAPLDPAAWLYRVGANLAISRTRRSRTGSASMSATHPPGSVATGA